MHDYDEDIAKIKLSMYLYALYPEDCPESIKTVAEKGSNLICRAFIKKYKEHKKKKEEDS